MSMDKKELTYLLNDELSRYGFRKKSTTWYRDLQESLQVVDLQKSNFSNLFYANICCVPGGMSVDGLPTPKENKCPIRIRLDSAFPKNKIEIQKALDLDSKEITDDDRATMISIFLRELILPFLENLKDLKNIKHSIESGLLDNGMVYVSAKKFLGISI
ncbi:MAG: DUF4304 domain-containing protein [Mesorhizobium sp.]|nr:MAG: DUF4304 domain-containing protein [Mesorhizobium sp.]RWC61250.1 MAG: DUF4304 domain-containing protein [Mesorhizobium sp.]